MDDEKRVAEKEISPEDPALAGYRTIAEAQEARLVAVEDLFLQVALDLTTLATALNGTQQNVVGLRHEQMSTDLRDIHARWVGMLKAAEAAGRVKLRRASSLIVPATSNKPN